MSTSSKLSNDDGVCEVNNKLQCMSTDDNTVSVCANCGKEGDHVNNICNKCKQVKYCNAVCKKKHRHKHKKDCEEYLRRAAEQAAKLHMKSYSNSLHHYMEIVQFAFYEYQRYIRVMNTTHAVERQYAAGAFMLPSMITKEM